MVAASVAEPHQRTLYLEPCLTILKYMQVKLVAAPVAAAVASGRATSVVVQANGKKCGAIFVYSSY